MTINDLAFEMAKNKDDEKSIKKIEKKIKLWESEKSYPTLEDIYQMAYIIKVNPGELLAIRNRGRKQFYKESGDPPTRKHDWIEITDNASIIFSGLSRTFGIFVLIVFMIVLYKFVDTYFGKTGGIVVDQVITQDIQKHTGQENEIINDGSVANMVRRIQKESKGINDNINLINNNVTDNILNSIEE